jgi:hypothetical protein
MPYYRELELILAGGDTARVSEARVILEDAENPIRRKTLDKLYQSIESKDHVDFGYIEKSAGQIIDYSGYSSMRESLKLLKSLNSADIRATREFLNQVSTVETAISNIAGHSYYYQQAFATKCEVLKLEYMSMTAACVEATTSLLYTFADFVRNPATGEVQPVLKNTKVRGDLFYIEQLRQFNQLVAGNGDSYKKYLKATLNNGTQHFLGVDDALVVGAAAIVTTVALSIVPITRKLIYSFQDCRRRLTDCLELQAYYLELNRSVVEARDDLSKDKKDKILKKQEAIRLKFLRLADKLRVTSMRNDSLTKRRLEEDNRILTMDNTRNEIDNDDFVLM